MSMMFFGARWDAPIVDDADEFPETPTYARCSRCHEFFTDGDQGVVLAHAGSVDPEHIVGISSGHYIVAEHRECQLSGVVGHLVGVCSCTGWEPDSRSTGREVLRRVEAGALHR